MRVLLCLALVAVAVALGSRLLPRGADAAGDGFGPALPAGVPGELAGVIGQLDRARRQALGGGLLRRAAADAQAAPTPAPPFADAGGRARVMAVRRAVRRSLRRGSGARERLRVVAWQGVVVTGRRAVARADVARETRQHSGWIGPPPARLTLGLLRDGGWRVVTTG